MHWESCNLFGIKEDDLRVISQVCKEDDVSIISTHDPIFFELKIPANPSQKLDKSVIKSAPLKNMKLVWESADIDLYQDTLETILDENFQLWNQPECIQTLALLIPHAYIQSAEVAVPSKQKKDINFKTVKSEQWLKAEISAKKAGKQWTIMGKPRNEENTFFLAKKETRLNLRKAIKSNISDCNTRANNEMMAANFRDPKLFSKLVNKNRVNSQGYTAMIKVKGEEYRGDAQVLSGFFTYHNENSSAPPLQKSEDNNMYFYSTINVQAISYIIKQRGWKLPQLTFNQVQNLIERLKTNKSPDSFGLSARHVQLGGFVSANYLMKYINTSFQFMEQGVPCEELVGAGSLVHKGGKKSLSEPKHFRKITVCALLGQIKQMAVCDLPLPILRPLKPQSQLGFTPGLFVKLANIIVTEKRALAIANNQVVLHQFLDATAAFDETLHPIILNKMFNGDIEDDIWQYFEQLHKNSTTHIKWNGLISEDFISEGKGNRQGGLASGDEWKIYNNEMVKQLEMQATDSDKISGISTSCVAVADDVAPCATADHPRDVLHQMQHLLSVVEDHGTQLHMKFGQDKCKLLISGRTQKIKSVQTLLQNEPEILTFYGSPVQTVQEPYVHIGVPQAVFKQSQVMADYRIEKGQNMSYKLQGATKNALSGVSPLSNRKMFLSYHQPSFLYGTDTMQLNVADIDRIEVKYRKVIKCMLS